MKRFQTALLGSLAILAQPALALASGGSEHGTEDFHLVDMAPSFVNFIILIVVMMWLFRDSTAKALRNRKAETMRAIEEAAEMKAAAEAKQTEYAERLKTLDAELEKMKRDMHEAGEAERARIIKEAEERAQRMRAEAEFLVAQQAKQMRLEITREAVDAAISAAEQILVQATTPQDQERLAAEYLAQLKGGTTEAVSAPAPARQESRV